MNKQDTEANQKAIDSLLNFETVKYFNAEKIDTHGGSLRVYISKSNKKKIHTNVKKLLNEEIKFGLKNYKTYLNFGKKVYEIRENVLRNLTKLKQKEKYYAEKLL